MIDLACGAARSAAPELKIALSLLSPHRRKQMTSSASCAAILVARMAADDLPNNVFECVLRNDSRETETLSNTVSFIG